MRAPEPSGHPVDSYGDSMFCELWADVVRRNPVSGYMFGRDPAPGPSGIESIPAFNGQPAVAGARGLGQFSSMVVSRTSIT